MVLGLSNLLWQSFRCGDVGMPNKHERFEAKNEGGYSNGNTLIMTHENGVSIVQAQSEDGRVLLALSLDDMKRLHDWCSSVLATAKGDS
jgi:hypothetical protein